MNEKMERQLKETMNVDLSEYRIFPNCIFYILTRNTLEIIQGYFWFICFPLVGKQKGSKALHSEERQLCFFTA